MSRKTLGGGLCALMGIGAAMSFVLSAEGYAGMSDLPASSTSPLWSALALVFGLLFWMVYMKKKLRPGLSHVLFGLLFGAANYFGTTLFAYDTWRFLSGPLAMGRAALSCLGQALPMIAALTLGSAWLEQGAPLKSPAGGFMGPWPFPRLQRLYREHTVFFCAVLFVLCWSPYLLIFYPGSLSWDIGEMLAQFFGKREMDTWHPVFLTWAAGALFSVGRLFGSDNLGAFLFTLLQTTALAYALGSAVAFLRKQGANRAFQLSALAFFGLTPLWGGYAQFICKDTLYTAALLLFTLDTLSLLRDKEKPPIQLWLRYGLCALLACLLRGNGIYVVLPTALVVVPFALRGQRRLLAGAALGAALALAFLFSGVLLPALGIRDETASGIYSVCFQQSARVLRDHAEAVTPEEYAEIDLVLDAANLPEKYEPWISDPVKYTFKQYGQGAAAEKIALARYQVTWLSMLSKYPVTYLEAFIAGNSAYYAFTPKLEGPTYNNQAGNRLVFETHPQVATNLDVHTSAIPAFGRLQTLLAAFARGIRHIPLLSLLYCCAAYTWTLAAAVISLGRQRRWKELTGFLPALLSLGVCLLSPVNDYFRYFLPIAAMTLPLLGFAAKRDA